MPSKRSMFLFGLVLLFLPTQVYGATLQYASGAFAVTPYIYGKIGETACGIPDPPVIGEYNPGPIVGINNLSGSKDMTIEWCAQIRSHVSWNLQATYGKIFSFSSETRNWVNQVQNHSDNRCSIRMNTQDGLFLQVTPEAGEKIGQSVKLYLSYNIYASSSTGCTNTDNDPADLIFESVGSQPNRITVNSVPKYSFPSSHISVDCLTSDCISWESADCGPVQFHITSHDGPYPFQYEVEPETFIEVNPGELIEYSLWGREFFVFDYPVQGKIGDLIGLNLGYFQDLSDIRSDLGGYPEIFTKFDFSLTAQVVPLPGSVFLLGAGLLLLAGARGRHRS